MIPRLKHNITKEIEPALKEKFGYLRGLKVGIVGDILHSRVARSNIYGLINMGAEVTVCGLSLIHI